MVAIKFTQNLKRHIDCEDQQVEATTVAEALQAYFEGRIENRSYIVDDQGALRHHMLIFVDGKPIQDREQLSDPVSSSSELYILQALSGG